MPRAFTYRIWEKKGDTTTPWRWRCVWVLGDEMRSEEGASTTEKLAQTAVLNIVARVTGLGFSP